MAHRAPRNTARLSSRTLQQMPLMSAICIGDSHCLKYTGKQIFFSDHTAIQFTTAYIPGFASLSLQSKSWSPEIVFSYVAKRIRNKIKSKLGMLFATRMINIIKRKLDVNVNSLVHQLVSCENSDYALKLLQSLGALSSDGNGLSQAASANDAAVAYAKCAPLVSPLVIITCGDIDMRSTVMSIGLEDANCSSTIQETFQHLLGFVAGLKAKGVNVVLEGLTPPSFDDAMFLLHNKFFLPPEIRGRVYLDCNEHLRKESANLGIVYLDLSLFCSNELGCLRDDFEYDGVHLCPSSVEVIASQLEGLFQHSPVNHSRYGLLLEKRSIPINPKPESVYTKTSARNSFLKNSILINRDCDQLVYALLKSICSQLKFSESVSNLHYRLDWAGNEREAYSEHIRYSPVSQTHLDIVHELIYGTSVFEFVADALGFDPCVYAYRAFRSIVHRDAGVGPQDYHHDGCPPGIYRMLIYLSEVDSNTGPFRYHLPNGLIHEVLGDFGTLIIFDANKLWHSAKPPHTRERIALDFCIGPRHEQSEQFVIAPGMNNWPCDPFLFSVNDMVVSPANDRRFLSFSPYPVKTEVPIQFQVNC